MLFTPEAHEALADEPWSAERARTAIASIVADAESAFDDGWPTHPKDAENEDDAAYAVPDAVSRRCGSCGCAPPPRAAGLRRVATGLRAVSGAFARRSARFSRLTTRAQSVDGRDRNPAGAPEARAVAGKSRAAVGADRGERARRAVRTDVGQSRHDSRGPRARARRDAEHRVVARAARRGRPVDAAPVRAKRAHLGPAHGFAGCALALGDGAGVSETLQPLRRRGGRARQLAADAGMRSSTTTATARSARSGATARRGSSRRSATCSTRSLRSRAAS